MESEFITRLRELIGDKSARAFAMEADVAETTLRQYLSGRSEPTMTNLRKICSYCDCSLDWLVNGTTAQPIEFLSNNDFDEEYALIPGYHIQVSAGHGAGLNGETVKRHLAFRRKWLKFRGLDINRLAVVFAKGDSMEPTIHSGDSILIDTSRNQVEDGSIFVLRLGDDLYAKRLQKSYDGSITIISDNKTDYQPLVVPADQLYNLAVIGKVVWVGHDIH
nr:helix-turn-helix transcriptional regulator [uncultured Tolumonas sp.]